MFPKSALIAAIVAALVVNATPALELKFSGPDEVNDVSDLKVVTTVTNTGDEAMKLLNDPSGVLDAFPTEAFAIQHSDSGASPDFIGARVKYVPATVIQMNDPSFFTVLKPGQSVDVTHDLSSAYDFSKTGQGKYTFTPSNSFLYVDPATSQAVPIYARSADSPQISISGPLIASTPEHNSTALTKRAIFIGCSADRQNQLNAAIPTAQNYVGRASQYTNGLTRATPRFTTWFGPFTTNSYTVIRNAFNTINGNNFNSFTYDCSTCTRPDVFAYVYPNMFGKIYLCGAFWPAPVSGTDSKGGTIVHESSHFDQNGGTRDYAYGQPDCMQLAQQRPDLAIHNADSYEYYSENNPPLQ